MLLFWLELAGRMPGRSGKSRFMDVVKDDMNRVGVREESAEDTVRWRQVMVCFNSQQH